jgi:hypothetical protein
MPEVGDWYEDGWNAAFLWLVTAIDEADVVHLRGFDTPDTPTQAFLLWPKDRFFALVDKQQLRLRQGARPDGPDEPDAGD